jgi:hypothetical protein
MSLTHLTTAAQRGPSILIEGTFGVPYYRAAAFADPVPTSDLTPAQRVCLMRELALWLNEASMAAEALANELERAGVIA